MLIPEASNMILEPVSQQITYAVLSRLGLRNTFDDNIYITNDYTKPSLTSDDDHNALISKDRCDIKMSVVWNPTEVKWDVNSFNYTQAYGISNTLDQRLVPIFYDIVAGVQITEHQLPCSMNLEFSLQFKNRESAFLAISAINNTSMKDSVINIHNLSYSYPVSSDMFACLNQIYQFKKDIIPFTLWEYLQNGSCGAIQFIQQRTGNQVELVVKRIDLKAMGVLEYTQSAPSVINQERGVDRFVVEFSYTIQFARPDALRFLFPVVVANQMIPNWMIPKYIESEFSKVTGILQERCLSGYLREIAIVPQVVARLPIYDDFRIPFQPVAALGFVEFFNAVVLLDNSYVTTINLLDLGENIRLNENVVEIMKLMGNSVFETEGLINITVYCNDIPIDNSLLSIDSNLVLTIAMRNKNKRYHLVISEATNLRHLDEIWFKTLIAYRTFFPITIIKNLQLLINRKYCFIDNNNEILQLVNYKITNTTINSQIASLITAGHLTYYTYSYTATAEQFIQYLIQQHSPITHQPVYNEYVNLCITSGLITKEKLSTGYIKTTNGYPFLSEEIRGTTPRFNLPLRIIESDIVVTR